jgi:hypothetical protein
VVRRKAILMILSGLAAGAASLAATTNGAPRALGGEAGGDSSRDPFWPIGYSPAAEEDALVEREEKGPTRAAARESLWRQAQAELNVGGMTRMGPTVLVMIEGSLVGAGDHVEKAMEGMVFRWQVTKIDTDKISLKKVSAEPAENATME